MLAVAMPTVDRNRWLRERLRFLGSQLDAAATDEQRSTIHAEIEALRNEAGIGRRLLGRLLGR